MNRSLQVTCVLLLAGTPTVASINASRPGKWTKCIGNEIAKCMSCVFEEAAHVLETVIEISEGAEFLAVAGVLESINTALECVEDCKHASTKTVVKECKSWYCTTDFCLTCCGSGHWQCQGTDFTPQCSPKSSGFVDNVLKITQKANKPTETPPKPAETPRKPVETRLPWPPANLTDDVEKCQCGPGSGDPDSCCSKCESSKDPHSVPHCAGGGKNTGPFCGNDFHVTEPNACYGSTPLCCTNDVGIPVCCRKGQVCHSPLLGDNHCRDPSEAVVV